MKEIIKKIARWAVSIVALMAGAFGVISERVAAESGYSIVMSPMEQKIVLVPGESYQASFRISNPSSQKESVNYSLSVEPFYANENNERVFQSAGDRSKMVDWITLVSPTSGILESNETGNIEFRIDVPETAPAGGQYASIIVTLNTGKDDEKTGEKEGEAGASIKEVWRMGHLIYADVAGETVRSGEIMDVNVPSFLLSGNISGSSLVKNTGNVHGDAEYTLQVFPLFSGEEVYTNEEKPETKVILPDRAVYSETAWEETPGIGIFNVVYTVKYEDSTAQVKKTVIICPLWLLFLIMFVIALLVIWIFMKVRNGKKRKSIRGEEE